MTSGDPNKGKEVNFTVKVRDKDGNFKPVYTPLDATDRVYGNVLLSDEADYPASEEARMCAATGVTAATPKAVKAANDNANSKLSKTNPNPQSVRSEVEFQSQITLDKGAVVPNGAFIIGDLKGNATSADKLKTKVHLNTQSGALNPSGSVLFDGSSDVTIPLGELDATKLKGIISLENLPQGALERVVNYASLQDAIDAYNAASADAKPFQEGDTVRITKDGNSIMYAVIGNPGAEKNYVEYAAGTAAKALEAEEALKLTTDAGSDTKPIYFKDGIPVVSAGNVGEEPLLNLSAGLGGTNIEYGMKPIYLKNGELITFTESVGSSNKPVYSDKGCIKAINYEINKSVPADAKFTDTTYEPFKADVDGLVPAPTEEESKNELLFLKSDGTWGELIGGSVTGVKGDTEYEYRTKNVNLTYENIGAVGLYDPSYNWKPADVEDFDFEAYSDYYWGSISPGNKAVGIKIKTENFTKSQKENFNFFYPYKYSYNTGLQNGTDLEYIYIEAPENTLVPYRYRDSLQSKEQALYLTFQLKSNKPFSEDIINTTGQVTGISCLSYPYLSGLDITAEYYDISFPSEDKTVLDITIQIYITNDVSLDSNKLGSFGIKFGNNLFTEKTHIEFDKEIYIVFPRTHFVNGDLSYGSSIATPFFETIKPVLNIENGFNLFNCEPLGNKVYNLSDLSGDASGDPRYGKVDIYPSLFIHKTDAGYVEKKFIFNINNEAFSKEEIDAWNQSYKTKTTLKEKGELLKEYINKVSNLFGDKLYAHYPYPWWDDFTLDEVENFYFIDPDKQEEELSFFELNPNCSFTLIIPINQEKFSSTGRLGLNIVFDDNAIQYGRNCTYYYNIATVSGTALEIYNSCYALHGKSQLSFPEFVSSETKPDSKQSMKALSPNVEDKIYTTTGGFMPGAETTNLGSIDEPFNEVYAQFFDGELVGNATTATTAKRLNSELSLTGNVTGSVSLNSDGNHSITTTISNSAVTLAKLGTDVGTVAVQSIQPTDSRIKLWIKI